MSRRSRTRGVIALAVLAFALAACGRGGGERYTSSPSMLDDACAILDQRPAYLKAMKAAERKWGVPVAVQMATIHQESKFDGDARTPVQWRLGVIPMGRQSSAFGYSQALDGTWDEYVAEEGGRRARRDEIGHATDFMGWYMTKTQAELGIPLNDAKNQYFAYHDGRGGYRRGTYRKKPWLLRVGDKVEERAYMYDQQLRACRKIRGRPFLPPRALVPTQT